MKRIHFKRWELEIDVNATSAAYGKRDRGAPEECGCQHCLNFAAAREHLYPQKVVEILSSLGVHPIREAEIWHNCEIRPGVHSYGGFMHVVGRILSGQDAKVPVGQNVGTFNLDSVTPTFHLGFRSDVQLVPDCFPRSGLFQIEFACEVPWVLIEPYDGPIFEGF